MSHLNDEQAAAALRQVPLWARDGEAICRTFTFRNFREALGFVVHVGCLAEKAGHHPDIAVHYREVTLKLWTHTENGLTEKDFDLAQKIDAVAA